MESKISEILDLVNAPEMSKKMSNSTYYNDDGVMVPRVTEVISTMIHSDALMYWANSLGFKGKGYRATLNAAAKIGTEAHTAIERFLKDKYESKTNIPFLGFLMWYNIVSVDRGLSINVIYIEHKIVCKWFGGTIDCLMNIGGKIYLVDFKTSNHVTYKYFLQLAAYRFMLRVVEGINVDGVIVLQLDKVEPGFNEYLLNFENLEHLNFIEQCERTFLSLVYGFVNIRYTEMLFNQIF